MFFLQLPRFMNDTRSWRTPLVPYQRNMKLTISSWFWLPPAFLVFSLQQFCSFYLITASTVSFTHSKTFWMVPKEVNTFKTMVELILYPLFCIAVQIEMPELWSRGTKIPVIQIVISMEIQLSDEPFRLERFHIKSEVIPIKTINIIDKIKYANYIKIPTFL